MAFTTNLRRTVRSAALAVALTLGAAGAVAGPASAASVVNTTNWVQQTQGAYTYNVPTAQWTGKTSAVSLLGNSGNTLVIMSPNSQQAIGFVWFTTSSAIQPASLAKQIAAKTPTAKNWKLVQKTAAAPMAAKPGWTSQEWIYQYSHKVKGQWIPTTLLLTVASTSANGTVTTSLTMSEAPTKQFVAALPTLTQIATTVTTN